MREKSNYIIIYYVTVTTNISQETLQIDEPELSYIQLSYIVVQPLILKETTIKQYYTPKCLISCSLSNCFFFCQVFLLISHKAGKAKWITGGPSSSCEMIILRNNSHGGIIRVCMGIFTTALRNKKNTSNSQKKYLTSRFQRT